MPDFLVEVYVGKVHAHEWADIVRRAQRAARLDGADERVRYLGSIGIPGDEMCFHLYAGPSTAAVADAVRRAAIAVERVIEAVPLAADGLRPVRRLSDGSDS